ncbi:GNAT family N-acetyltransferase [Acinetobacter wanghuae]|uniref:GNAT family N-acetyltransferase n=1 Tax=Acinetobacter wanghuae TaxID=2662362 RepID=UPI003AF783AC
MVAAFKIRSGTWQELAIDAKPIRESVFIQEQHIAPEDEWDEFDPVSIHFVVYEHDQAIATARLLANHSIGRVAVLKTHRGLKIGYKLMQAVIDYAKREQRPFLKLSSQVHAIGFYHALGFKQQGEAYLDCGIPHIDMYMALQ